MLQAVGKFALAYPEYVTISIFLSILVLNEFIDIWWGRRILNKEGLSGAMTTILVGAVLYTLAKRAAVRCPKCEPSGALDVPFVALATAILVGTAVAAVAVAFHLDSKVLKKVLATCGVAIMPLFIALLVRRATAQCDPC